MAVRMSDALGDDVAPFDEHHGVVVDQLGQADVDDLLHVVEPVDVDVDERQVAFVLTRKDECRAGHW